MIFSLTKLGVLSNHSQNSCYNTQTQFVSIQKNYQKRKSINCRINKKVEAQQSVDVLVKSEQDINGMTAFLDSLNWDQQGLVTVIVQHVDTGELLMQAFADRSAIAETLQSKLGTFYSRSRKGRWVKGETSNHFLNIVNVYFDCDKDSVIYVADPIGPSCHTNARTCWFQQVDVVNDELISGGTHDSEEFMPRTSLLELEKIIQDRRVAMEKQVEGEKPSWTAKLLNNPDLLCKKIREEAGELCETLEKQEGPERCASEMADVLYHSMVLLNKQGVKVEDVLRILRSRFGVSGIEEKASRK
eukprot:TRINITY_DN2208_c1_g1_i12.p1 TRINITY_DN2208_c1_g1~~TRINITY_DN2208_c1_g1_i12.p1  ORF type:complete len:311 (+),score=19.20 TRINITY_DN2208_c1_g1_i12:31-933(+)